MPLGSWSYVLSLIHEANTYIRRHALNREQAVKGIDLPLAAPVLGNKWSSYCGLWCTDWEVGEIQSHWQSCNCQIQNECMMNPRIRRCLYYVTKMNSIAVLGVMHAVASEYRVVIPHVT
jgi:hypothetical protein